jgi:peroxiredoxin
MRNYFCLAVYLLAALGSNAQAPKEIIRKSIEKCKTIENGYYELNKKTKYLMKEDTAKYSLKCYFKSLKNDTLSAFIYHNKNDVYGYVFDELYDGSNFYHNRGGDSVLEIVPKEKYPDIVKFYVENGEFFKPALNLDSDIFPEDSTLIDSTRTFDYIGEENINNYNCYKIKMSIKPWYDDENKMDVKKAENFYWINKTDYMPVRIKSNFDIEMNGETFYQYFDYELRKYSFNSLTSDSVFLKKSIENIVKEKEYTPPQEERPLLANGEIAPEWKYKTIDDKDIKLSDFRGSVTLVYFFTRFCGGCLNAIPSLVSLNAKFKDKGVNIISLAPYDEKDNQLLNLLKKMKVDYKFVMADKQVAEDYQVDSINALFIVDKNGKIYASYNGYFPEMQEDVEKAINQALEQK